MDIVFLLIGLAVGALIGWLLGKNKSNTSQTSEVDLEKDFVRKERFEDLKKSEEKLSLEIDEKQGELIISSKEVVVWQERYTALDEKLKSQKEETEKLQEKFKNDFKVLAQEILDKNSKSFTDMLCLRANFQSS